MSKNVSIRKLTLLCAVVYFAGYLTRLDYAAAISEIVNDMGVTKQLASLAVTGSFFTYGAGQIISGMMGDRFDPRKLIAFGLSMSSLVNLLMFVLKDIYVMSVIWWFNGFFQALLWPPMVRICAENMNSDEYKRCTVRVSAAASIATICIYLIVPAAITIAGWRYAFLFDGACGLVITAIWLKGTSGIRSKVTEKEDQTADQTKGGMAVLKIALASGLVSVLVAIAMQGILRDGITTWMPSYITDVFKLPTEKSILTTTLLPIFSIISLEISDAIEKKFRNEQKTSLFFFVITTIASLLLAWLFSKVFVIDILLMVIITGSAHGINLMLTTRYCTRFLKFGKVSTVSGIANAATYIGSAVSTYGFAALSDSIGWQGTVLIWALVSFVGAVACVINIKKLAKSHF